VTLSTSVVGERQCSVDDRGALMAARGKLMIYMYVYRRAVKENVEDRGKTRQVKTLIFCQRKQY